MSQPVLNISFDGPLDRLEAEFVKISGDLRAAIERAEKLRQQVTDAYSAGVFKGDVNAVPAVTRNLSIVVTETEGALLRSFHALDKFRAARSHEGLKSKVP